MPFEAGLIPARTSLAARLAFASAGVGLVIGLIAIAIAIIALSHRLDQRVQAELEGKRDLVLHVLSEMDSVASMGPQNHRFNDLLIGHDDLHLAIVAIGTDSTILNSSPTATQSVRAASRQADNTSLIDWRAQSGATLGSLISTGTVANGERVRFVLSQDRANDRRLLRGLIEGALVGLPVLMIFIIAGGWAVARTGLEPLERFERLARASSTTQLTQRLTLDNLPKELRALGVAFNAMLDRIDAGVLRLSRAAGDLAHEMRTPVGTLLGLSQVTLSQERTADELRSVIERNVEELERLSRLISDMLFLARAENESEALRTETVSLRQEAERISDYLAVVADERGLVIEVSGSAAVVGEQLLIQRAITNLLSNAIRHAPDKTTIRIEIGVQAGCPTLSVVNVGDVIAADHLPLLFDRFFRADSSRSRHDGGIGLGLSIVQAIMHLHGGSVGVTSTPRPGGHGETRFALTFPRDDSPSSAGASASSA